MKSFLAHVIAGVLSSMLLVSCGGGSSSVSTAASSALLGLTVDDSTTPTKLYVSNFGTNVIGSVAIAGGNLTSMTNASPAFNGPEGLLLIGADLFVVDALNHAIRKVVTTAPYTTTTYAGVLGAGGNDNTTVAYPTGKYNLPRNAVADVAGNIYVTDSVNNAVRKIEAVTKVVTTIASGFNNPWGITIDNAAPQNLYVTDLGNHSIKKLTDGGLAGWSVSTIAGDTLNRSGLPNNANGTAAFFKSPLGITTDNTYLYVVDSGNNAIRRIDLTLPNAVELIAGSSLGTAGNSVHATGTSALFNIPAAITYGGGFLYVSDQDGKLIRKVSTTAPYPVSAFTLN